MPSLPDTATHQVMMDMTCEDVRLVVLRSLTDTCYTVYLHKYGKLIGEAISESNNLSEALCKAIASIPVDPKILQLN